MNRSQRCAGSPVLCRPDPRATYPALAQVVCLTGDVAACIVADLSLQATSFSDKVAHNSAVPGGFTFDTMDTALAAAQAGPSVQEVAATQSSDTSVDLAKHPSGIIPTLQNIVATVNLDCKLDLKTIALRARNAEYNPKV